MEAFTPHIIVGIIFLAAAFVYGYVRLGMWITDTTSDIYDYCIWNWITILTMLYMVFVWVLYIIGSGDATLQETNAMWLSSAIAFIVLWIRNSIRTSFVRGFCVSVYQSSVCAITIVIVMMFLCGGGRSRKE
ncbi:MAG TPA: hypothetical protein VMV86_04425 [Methanosarcinales archaeon]|nr:hypothetical protein [Methanosarcinales archaeon]